MVLASMEFEVVMPAGRTMLLNAQSRLDENVLIAAVPGRRIHRARLSLYAQ